MRIPVRTPTLLRMSGVYSFFELSVPLNRLLRPSYMFYLKPIIPIFGHLLLGNPDNYRMLGVYTAQFGS